MLEEKIDEKIAAAIKPLNSRIDEVHESIFSLQSAGMAGGLGSSQPMQELEDIDLELRQV